MKTYMYLEMLVNLGPLEHSLYEYNVVYNFQSELINNLQIGYLLKIIKQKRTFSFIFHQSSDFLNG